MRSLPAHAHLRTIAGLSLHHAFVGGAQFRPLGAQARVGLIGQQHGVHQGLAKAGPCDKHP